MKSLCVLLVFVVLYACQEASRYDKQTYSDISVVEKLNGQEVVLQDSIFFTTPKIMIQDSLCCIFDLGAREGHFCHIFTYPDFTYKYSMVKVGRGENEIINPSRVRLYKNHVYIVDNLRQKIWCYDITNPDTQPICSYAFKDFLYDFVILNDGSLVVSSVVNKIYRINRYDSQGNILDSLLQIPSYRRDNRSLSNINEIWLSLLGYDSQDNVLVLGTKFGEVLETLNMKTKEYRIAVGPGGKPAFDYKGKNIVIPGKILGFNEISVYGEYIYALFSGISQKDFIWNDTDENYKLYVYTKQGKPIKCYQFDRPVSSCCIDWKRKKIYATDKTSEWMLSVFEF